MKRILVVITGLGVGGAETQAVQLAIRLKGRGWEVRVVSLTPPGILAKELEANEVPVISLGMRHRFPNPCSLLRLARLIRSWRPHVVHTHMFHANLLARLVRPVAPVPVLICTAHNTYEASSRAKNLHEITWRERAYRLTDFLCDLTTQISKAGLERYIAVRAAPKPKMRLVYNGIDTERFRPDALERGRVRADLQLEGRFVWLAVGRIEIQKDYPTLLRAFNALDRPESVLCIAGDGSLREHVKSLMRSMGLESRVRLLGRQENIPGLMNAADGFVLSSAWEGFGLVVAEAMACQLPVVVTDSGGPRELVDDGRAGFLVPPRSHSALAGAVLHVMDLSEQERRSLGEQGRERIVRHFSLDHVLHQWEAVYAEFLDLRGGKPRRTTLRAATR